MATKYTYLTGQTINKLKILEVYSSSRCKVLCICCGKIKFVQVGNILHERTKSCGCQQNKWCRLKGKNNPYFKDLTGQRFGKLLVIAPDKTIKKRGTHFLCNCDCGNSKIVSRRCLKHRNVISCGCSHHAIRGDSPLWTGYEEISGRLWTKIQREARVRNFSVSITIQYIWNLFIKQDRKCALTGKKLKFDTHARSKDGNASLDRIDSSKGYIEGNVQWVDKKINMLKCDFSENDFFDMCKQVCLYKKLLE